MSQRETAAKWYLRFGFTDVFTLLHLPFTSIVMAFVVVGAATAGTFYLDRLAWALLAVFCALQASHFLDEIKGHHWSTKIPSKNLFVTGFFLLAAAVAVGVYLSLTVSALLFLFIVPMVFFPVTYNLELLNKRFHNALWFGVSWGALVFLGSFFLQNLNLTVYSVLMSAAIGIQSAYISVLYESTKKSETREFSWKILKGTVILWNLIAIALLLAKLT